MIETTAAKARQAFAPKPVVRAFKQRLGDASQESKVVLAWLADLCHATETVSRGTREETERAIGRREVWLAVQDVMRITEADLRDMQEQVGEWREQ